jgi:hypothetical protein
MQLWILETILFKWLESYGRRNAIESVNAEIKTRRADIKRSYTHVFGLVKNTLLIAFGC